MLPKITYGLFVLYVLTLPVVQPADLYLFGLQLQISDAIFSVACTAFALSFLAGRIRFVGSRLYLWIAVYVAAFAVSTLFSAAPGRSAIKLIGVFYLAAVAVLTVQLTSNKRVFKWTVIALAAGAGITSIAAAVGIALYYAGYDDPRVNFLLFKFGSLPAGHYPRVQAFFSNANMMCSYLNVGVVCIVIAMRSKWLDGRLGVPLFVGTLAAAAFTISPGIGGILLSLGVWYWKDDVRLPSRPLRNGILLTAVAAALLFYAAAAVSPDTENTDLDLRVPFTNTVVEPSVRALIWGRTAAAILAHPVTGVGTGIDAVVVRYTALSGDQQRLTDAHNMWLNVTAQAGVLGLAAMLLLIRSLWSIVAPAHGDREEIASIRLGFMCIFVGAFLYQGLAGSFEDARHLWVVFGLIGAIEHLGPLESTNQRKIDPPANS